MTEHLRIAIAHDYLTQRGGAERVVLSLRKAFPEAPIFTTLYNPETTFPEFRDARIITSWLNKLPPFRRDHRIGLPLLKHAANALPIDADVVVASSTGWAHGFPSTGEKLVYCHSPARYLYLTDEYLGSSARSSAKGWAVSALRPSLVRWDQKAARSASKYLCNSTVVQQRIERVYGLPADVVAPPAGVDAAGSQAPVAGLADWPDFHLVVSRLMPYKNVDKVIEAFRGLDERLVIVGRGPERDHLRALAPANVRLLENLPDAELRWIYAHARALIAPSFEDFGLTPLEASAYGKPTLALHAGGYLDTITPGRNGAFFEASTADDIRQAVLSNRAQGWDATDIRACMEQFSEASFISRLRSEVDQLLGSG